MKLKIATTGLSGLVGSRIKEILGSSVDFIEIRQHEVDITDKKAIDEYFQSIEADIVLHLAAYTNVDACEDNKETAWAVNVEGTRNLFDAANERGCKFIYMSTGFVFDGEHSPYFEDSEPHPLSYYGLTKYEGEKIISGKGMAVRIDYPYGSKSVNKKDFVSSIIDGLKDKAPIRGITDQIFTPTYIDDIAHGLKYLFTNFTPQIFHLVGADSLSGYDAIKTIGEVFDIDTGWVQATTYDEFYKNKAPRPKVNILKSNESTYHPMKTFREGLEDMKLRF